MDCTVHGILQIRILEWVAFSLLQGIFPTQGSNPDLPLCRRILYQLSQKGSPRILEWVAYPLSSASSKPRNRTSVSRIAGGFFTNWAIREALTLKVTALLHTVLPFPLFWFGPCFITTWNYHDFYVLYIYIFFFSLSSCHTISLQRLYWYESFHIFLLLE